MAKINRSMGSLKRPEARTITRELQDRQTGTVVTLTLRSPDGMERMGIARRGRELIAEWGSGQGNHHARGVMLPIADEKGIPVVIELDDDFLCSVGMLEVMEVPEDGARPWSIVEWATIALTEADIWLQACMMAQELMPFLDPEQAKNLTPGETGGSPSAPLSIGDSPIPNSAAPSSASNGPSEPSPVDSARSPIVTIMTPQ